MDWERHVITIQLDELQVSDCVALPHVISLSLVYQVGQANETPNIRIPSGLQLSSTGF